MLPVPVLGKGVSTSGKPGSVPARSPSLRAPNTIQRLVGFEYELGIGTEKNISINPMVETWVAHDKGDLIMPRTGYDITADITAGGSEIEFILTEINENDPVACQAMINAAQQVRNDIARIMNASGGNWVRADQVGGLNGPATHRFQTQGRWDQLAGQLQMTGGVHISKLANVVSGSAHAASSPYNAGNYSAAMNPQPIWHAARTAVNGQFGNWWASEREVLASVITILAQIPLNARGALPAGQGQFLARTDYSKILLEAAGHLNRPIPRQPFLTAVLQTINSQLPLAQQVTHADNVFPATYSANGQTLTGLSIGTWVRDMLPTGFAQGTDRVTRANFPGTAAQQRELRPFGGFGNQMDPGNKLIFEWRNLTVSHPDDLPRMVRDLLNYVRLANAPTRWERFTSAISSAANTAANFVVRASQNPYVRTAALIGGALALHAMAPVIMMKPDRSRPRPHKPCQLAARIVVS